MKNNNINAVKRMFAICLALVLISITNIVGFAADPIALTTSNIVTYPTIEGTGYYGQKLGDAFKLVGGEVQYNGIKVEGEFQFDDPTLTCAVGNGIRSNIKFVPTNSSEYAGFSERRSRNVKYTAVKGEVVLMDSNNPPIASMIAEGQKLSDSIISGGQVKNKYNSEMEDVLAATWSWVNPDTVVTESGYYQAIISVSSNYNDLTLDVYVEIEGNKIVPEISVDSLEVEYEPNKTFSSIDYSVINAVNTETNEKVAGEITISNDFSTLPFKVGSYEIDATFTPNDTEAYTSVEFKIPVTVNAASITFETEDGTGIPTITVDYGKKTNDDMALLLKHYVPEDVQIQYIDFYDLDGQLLEHANKIYDPGSYTFTCRARTQNKNYATSMLTFNVVINKVKINPQIEGNGNRMIIHDVTGQYNPKGTFDLYINDELVKEDIPYNEYFTWEHTTSGDKNFKAVYKPGDDNRYEIDPITRADGEVKLDWPFASGDGHSTTYTYGETVKVEAPATDPAKPDKPYYGFAGWNVVEGDPGLTEEELASPTVSFEMPDGGVKLEPTYEFSLELFFQWIWQQIVDFFTFIFNAITELFALAA